MRNRALIPATALILLAGCSPSGSSQTADTSTEQASATAPAQGQPAPVEVTLPQLAYSYKLGFLVPADKVGAAQDAHRALCDRLGPARCQMLALSKGSADDASGQATLKLRVATADARAFSDQATRAVAGVGGRPVATNVEAEDVSKKITDVEARIKQRELLVARLTDVLRTRSGKVSELVEAERSVAQAQEELDQARAWLAELRGRVAMSDFEISYSAVAPSATAQGIGAQLAEAVTGSGSAFVIGMRGLLTIAIYLLPWALVLLLGWLAARAIRRRRNPPRDAG